MTSETNRKKLAAYDRLIESLEAWREQEKGLTRAVLDEVLEAAHKIEGEEMAAQMGGK